MVYVCAHLLGRKKEWCWPVPIDGPDARPGPESILGHGARRSRSVAAMVHGRREQGRRRDVGTPSIDPGVVTRSFSHPARRNHDG